MLSKQVDKQAFIFLKDVSFPDLRALVDYMYKGEVNVAQEHLASFLQTAEALDIKGIHSNNVLLLYVKYTKITFFPLGLAYKEGESSKSKSGQNTRSAAVKRPNESQGTTSPSTSQNHTQKPDNDTSQPHQNQTAKPRPPPAKKAHISPASPSINRPNTDADDHFVAVDAKLESEIDDMEDQLETNGPEWTSRV